MPSDTTLPGAFGSVFWYIGEIAFRWVPGVVVSIVGGVPADSAPQAPLPTITQTVRVEDIVQFIRNTTPSGAFDRFYNDWNLLVALSLVLSLMGAAVTVYSVMRVFQLRQQEYKYFQSFAHTVAAQDVPKTRLRWNHILEEANSENPQSQRLAILEADIMLGELLDELGYKGETLADRMRQVPKANFNTIDLAWEAHRARNQIAHNPGFDMPSREVRRIIGLYDKVFREFGFIES